MPEELIIESDGLRWHHFDDPEDPELVVLAAQYQLHELAIEDCQNTSQRAKLDDYGNHLFFVFNTLHFKEKEEILLIGKLCIFAGDTFVVTVSNGESRTVSHVRSKLKAGADVVRPDRLVHALLDFVCDQFQPLIDLIAEDIAELEASILENPQPSDSIRTFGIKRVLVSLRRVAAAHREIVAQLLRRSPPFVDQQFNLYFRDIYDHLLLALELIESNRDLVLGIIDVNLSATAYRTNEIVKTLTVYATILLPLNLITGFFGMNFEPMPLLHDKIGLPLVCLVMLLTTVMVSRYLRTREW
jgi:magnesium transporter